RTSRACLDVSALCQKRTHAPRLRVRALVLQLLDFSALSLFPRRMGLTILRVILKTLFWLSPHPAPSGSSVSGIADGGNEFASPFARLSILSRGQSFMSSSPFSRSPFPAC